MNHPAANSPIPTPRAKLSAGRLLLGCISIPLLLLAVTIASGVVWWFADNRKAEQELAIEVQKLRGREDPLTTVELDDYYVAAPNRPDMTAQILTALALCESPGFKSQAQPLPIVGTGPNIPQPPAEWTQLAEAESYLQNLQPALEVFHGVAAQDGTARYPVDLSTGLAARLEHVQSLRTGARVLSLQCHVDLHRDRPHEAAESLLAMLALARTLDREPCLVSQLVRIAINGMAIHDIQFALAAVHISDEDLVRLQHALRRMEIEPSLRRAFAGECAFGYMGCVDPLATSGLTPSQAKQIAGRTPQRRYDAAMILRNNSRIIDASNSGLAAALSEAQDVEDELQDLMTSRHQRLIYMMSGLLSPAYSKGVEAFARSAAQRDTADAAISAERYRRRHGHWPDKLEQLVPDFLPAVPVDPFNNQPLKMVVTPSEFKVYSVGKDVRNDRGDIFTGGKNGEPADVGFTIPARGVESPAK